MFTLAGCPLSQARTVPVFIRTFTSTYFSFALKPAGPWENYFFDGFLTLARLRTSGQSPCGASTGTEANCRCDGPGLLHLLVIALAGNRLQKPVLIRDQHRCFHSGKAPGQRLSRGFPRPNTTLPLDLSYQEFSRVQRPWIRRFYSRLAPGTHYYQNLFRMVKSTCLDKDSHN